MGDGNLDEAQPSNKILEVLLLIFLVASELILGSFAINRFVTNVFPHSVDKGILHPQVRFPPPTSKWLDDFNMNGTPAICGVNKCAFRSKTKEYGYLVTQGNQTMSGAWEKVQSLSDQFSIQHLFLGPPVPFNCSNSFAKLLNQNSEHSNSARADKKPIFYRTKPKQLKETQLIVQPIELAPKDSILYGCGRGNNKIELARKGLIQYFADDSNRSSIHPPSDLDLLTFDETLEFGFRSTENMLASEEGKCMHKDFQVLIDPLSGSIYQLDFNRCFDPKPVKPGQIKKCRKRFRGFVNDLKRCKRGSCHPREVEEWDKI